MLILFWAPVGDFEPLVGGYRVRAPCPFRRNIIFIHVDAARTLHIR